LNFKGAVKSPLLIPAKSKLAIIATLRIILAAPLQSALISQPLPARYNPRLTRLPDGSQPSGFEPDLTRIVDRAVVQLVGLRAKILKNCLSIFAQMQQVLLASVGHLKPQKI
jgi:hypothetical protein